MCVHHVYLLFSVYTRSMQIVNIMCMVYSENEVMHMGTDWKRIQLLLLPEMVERVDEWRRKQKDLPDRNEAIRRLLGAALGTKKENPGNPPQ